MSDWQPIDTAPKDREILVVDKFGHRALVRWNRYYWSLTEAGSYAEDTEFSDVVMWAPGALPEPPEELTNPPAKTYWWDEVSKKAVDLRR